MFQTRLKSGIVLVAAALVTIWCSGIVLCCTLLALSLIGMSEYYRVMGLHKEHYGILEITAFASAVLYYIGVYANAGRYAAAAIVLPLILLMGVYVFAYPRIVIQDIQTAYFGFLYVAVMLSFILRTRLLPDGGYLVWLIFLCSWGCDTLAYCTGMLIGKHKMAPILSPKKTVEGAIGGVLGAAILGLIFAAVTGGTLYRYALICAVGALISMIGDLAASAIKRNQDVKDYGTLIPGHGGVLDRFDSVIFTAPVIYFLAMLVLY